MKHHVTIPLFRHHSALCDLSPFPWAGQIQSPSSMTTSHISYKPKSLIPQFHILMMCLSEVPRLVISYQTAHMKRIPANLESADSFGNISKASIALFSE